MKQHVWLLIALTFKVVYCAPAQQIPKCSSDAPRYCRYEDDGSTQTYQFVAYTDYEEITSPVDNDGNVLDNNREIRQEWEMFEGSIPLTQVGVMWKEISGASGDQICG